VLGSAISALGSRLDSRFLTAFWLPAFVLVFGSIGIVTALMGASQAEAWVTNLGTGGQFLVVLLLVLFITVLAYAFRSLTWTIAATFAGEALPKAMASWSRRGQRRAKTRELEALQSTPPSVSSSAAARQADQQLDLLFPRNDEDLKPTRFGNVLAAASEHPRLVYAMEGAFWWPRLSPMLPGFFQEMLGSTQAPMMGLLNLSVVFSGLAVLGAAALGLGGSLWLAALTVLVVGLVLARLSYRAALTQAVGLGSQLVVAFDLYRHEILRQMDIEIPLDIAAERELWQQMTGQLLNKSAIAPVVESPPER
jgi:hypothetical protein